MINNTVPYQNNVLALTKCGFWTNEMAASSLGLSVRQVQRLKNGKNEFERSNNLPRIPWNRKSQKVIDLVVEMKDEYPTRSNQRIAELVTDRLGESLCASSVRKILLEEEKYYPRQSYKQSYTKFEADKFGQLLQLDTTEGCWLEGYRRIYLILLIDDYSRMIVGYKWVDTDSTWNNIMVLKELFEEYGKPGGIYTDNSSKFKTIRHDKSIYQTHKGDEYYETEIQRMMRELKIPFFSHKPYHPQSKGKIERLFRFIQERFITEHIATNLDELNLYFHAWVDWYNNEHRIRTTGKIPRERTKPSAWVPLSEDPNRIFCYKDSRKVDKCHQFSYQGEIYTLPDEPCLVACRVSLEITPEVINVYYQGKWISVFLRKKKNQNK